MVRVCHLPRLSSGLPPSRAAFVLFRQSSSRFPAVGEKDAQPVTAEKENKNMNFKSNNRNSNSSHTAPHSTNAAQHSNRQPSTTQQTIAENVKHLIEQLEQGKSEALMAYLNAMAHFHNYSFGNILSIAHYRPDATHVAGIRKWNEFGRYVKKGQKGIPILPR
jgi:N-terminal domain of anti-restriction factor ArdC